MRDNKQKNLTSSQIQCGLCHVYKQKLLRIYHKGCVLEMLCGSCGVISCLALGHDIEAPPLPKIKDTKESTYVG